MAREPKDPRTMPAAAINLEMDRLSDRQAVVSQALIDAGRGYETWVETLEKTDPLSLKFQALSERGRVLRIEVERRAGPGMRRLPRGFGPLRGY